MAHVHARKANDVVPGAIEVGPDVIGRLIDLLADGKSVESATGHLNRAWSYGEIDGPSAPLVSADGRVIDPDKQRAFAISEVAALCALPEVIEGVKALQAEHAKFAAEERHEARVEQLALARTIKQARAERKHCPLLYAQVEQLTQAVEWLIDRSFDKYPGEFERVLPELKDEEPSELKY